MANARSFWVTPKGMAALALIGAVTYFLLMEHRTHFFTYLPFLILLLCPVMHLFLHGNHGHGGHEGGEEAHHHSDSSEEDAYRRGLEDGRKQAIRSNKVEDGR